MRLRWTSPAADDLEAAHDYYHDLNPNAARRIARRVADAAMQLQQQPGLGRPGVREGTREWVVSQTPYVLVYRQTPNAVEILHVWHSAQDWTRQND